MGFWNPRAICPKCGAKIHTQGRRAGEVCPMCGTALSREIDVANVAISPERVEWRDEAPNAVRRELRRAAVYLHMDGLIRKG